MSDDPKPRRIGFERKEPARPQHDQLCPRQKYENAKALFAAIMDDAQKG